MTPPGWVRLAASHRGYSADEENYTRRAWQIAVSAKFDGHAGSLAAAGLHFARQCAAEGDGRLRRLGRRKAESLVLAINRPLKPSRRRPPGLPAWRYRQRPAHGCGQGAERCLHDLDMALFPLRRLSARSVLSAGVLVCSSLAALQSAHADKIKHPIAVFSGLDKITGRIISFEVAMDESVQFGRCKSPSGLVIHARPPKAPQTTTFVEVDEVDAQNDYKRIFSGWMFASSPGCCMQSSIRSMISG